MTKPYKGKYIYTVTVMATREEKQVEGVDLWEVLTTLKLDHMDDIRYETKVKLR